MIHHSIMIREEYRDLKNMANGRIWIGIFHIADSDVQAKLQAAFGDIPARYLPTVPRDGELGDLFLAAYLKPEVANQNGAAIVRRYHELTDYIIVRARRHGFDIGEIIGPTLYKIVDGWKPGGTGFSPR